MNKQQLSVLNLQDSLLVLNVYFFTAEFLHHVGNTETASSSSDIHISDSDRRGSFTGLVQ